MAYTPNDIAVFAPERNNSLSNNGGMTTRTTLTTGVLNLVFADVSNVERADGSELLRKLVFKPAVATLDAIYDCYPVCTKLDNLADASGIFMYVANGTEYDTQQDTESYTFKPMAKITSVAGGFAYVPKNDYDDGTQHVGAVLIYNPTSGDLRTDNVSLATASGNYWELTLDNTIGQTVQGELIIWGVMYSGGVSAGTTRTNISPVVDTVSFTSGATGVFVNNVVPSPVGAIRDIFTLTFTSADTYNLVGTNSGVSLSGNKNSDLTVYHPKAVTNNVNDVLMTVPSSCFTGTWQAGDTVSFYVESGAVALWFKRVVKAGAPASAGSIMLGLSLAYTTA